MSKRVVVCCDGTWNTPDQKDDGVVCPTNVTRLAMAVAPYAGNGKPQMRYYDTGVGTQWYDRIRDGVSGMGISRNILQAYRFLMELYGEGDDIFLFGFSRGAYTVHSLAGLLRNSGLLLPRTCTDWTTPTGSTAAATPSSTPRAIESELFRRTYAREVRVHCIRV
ncbi:T6SS phospholipase effector Tle1-like catalytic domain-containing protein, partial [Desulfomicrobium escambiense]|uniref:phospholipase effector Tle1 domain-containing protein n=1 Tax=Desulfomicrobium escambiense TaxID=29503 RepID=UPI000400A835